MELAKIGFVKSRLWNSKSKLGTRLSLDLCQKVNFKVDFRSGKLRPRLHQALNTTSLLVIFKLKRTFCNHCSFDLQTSLVHEELAPHYKTQTTKCYSSCQHVSPEKMRRGHSEDQEMVSFETCQQDGPLLRWEVNIPKRLKSEICYGKLSLSE